MKIKWPNFRKENITPYQKKRKENIVHLKKKFYIKINDILLINE